MSDGWDVDWSAGLALMMGPYEVGLTETSPETAGYWDGVARGELMVKRCTLCGDHLYPRRMFCPRCGDDALEWVRASGRGRVYTFSTIYRAPDRSLPVPYTNGIVALEEGVYLYGRLTGKPGEEIAIDDPVEVEFASVVSGQPRLPIFRILVESGQSESPQPE
jgi:uncharacterized protein